MLSRGDVYLLGEAYAFGVVWSFFLKALGVLALRFQRHDQEYKVPFNLRIAGKEIPVGLGATTLMLVVRGNCQPVLEAVRDHLRRCVSPLRSFWCSPFPNRSMDEAQALHEHHLEEFNLEHGAVG